MTPQPPPDPRTGLRVVHRRYVPYAHAHYAGNLVDGAYGLGLFGDVATELCIRSDGDEGLFASYSEVQFRAPVRAGDCIEVTAELVRVGAGSRTMEFRLLAVDPRAPGAGGLGGRGAPGATGRDPGHRRGGRTIRRVPEDTPKRPDLG